MCEEQGVDFVDICVERAPALDLFVREPDRWVHSLQFGFFLCGRAELEGRPLETARLDEKT